MLGLDTNVLVRLLIEDDAAQTRRARKLVDTAIAEEETVLVSLTVLRKPPACQGHPKHSLGLRKAGGGLISRRSSRRTEPRTQLVDAAPHISSNGPRDLQTPADVHGQWDGYPRAPWHCRRRNNSL